MLRELAQAGPETGFLGHTQFGLGGTVQYWRSFEHLEAYASAPKMQHWPAWRAFNKASRGGRGDVGIWQETYLVKAGNYEAIYAGMPPFGLGKAAGTVPATGNREAARQRLSANM